MEEITTKLLDYGSLGIFAIALIFVIRYLNKDIQKLRAEITTIRNGNETFRENMIEKLFTIVTTSQAAFDKNSDFLNKLATHLENKLK